mmetsp:Transcript_20618/g.30617  ORF Transcript_20618/g.30617 Transcript_20618/m.30617 type:complete len:199 (+) Transcript_20618:55-651(+)
MQYIYFIVILICLCQCVSGSTKYTLKGKVLAPSREVSRSAGVQLRGNGVDRRVNIRADGTFFIFDVSAGAYEVQVLSNNLEFEPLRVICSKGKITAKLAYTNSPLSHPFRISPHAQPNIFEERKGFDFLALVKSPMVLLIGGSVVMMFFMPKIMAANQEAMSELEEDGVEMPSWMKMIAPQSTKKRNNKSLKPIKSKK